MAGRVCLPEMRREGRLGDGSRTVPVFRLPQPAIRRVRDVVPPLQPVDENVVSGDVVHLLRRAMVRPGRERLSGVVETDEAYLGAPREGRTGRGAYGKQLVFVAVERKGSKMGRIRMASIPDASKESLQVAVGDNIEPGAEVHTDGWFGYKWMEKDSSSYRRIKANEAEGAVSECLLPKCHLVISLFRRWLDGTLQGSVGTDHLQDYLNEFVFRFNRRSSRSRGLLFRRLAEMAVVSKPNPRMSIIGGSHQDVVLG